MVSMAASANCLIATGIQIATDAARAQPQTVRALVTQTGEVLRVRRRRVLTRFSRAMRPPVAHV